MNTEETTPVPNVIDRYEDEKPCDSRSWSCENPEHLGTVEWSDKPTCTRPEDDGTMTENVQELRNVVVGRKIVKAEKRALTDDEKNTLKDGGRYYWGASDALILELDSGHQVVVRDTSDCCAYTALDKFLYDPAGVDHMILGVGTEDGFDTWHIYADFGDVLKLDVGWSCGNPFYYGYGFDITVIPITIDGEVIEDIPALPGARLALPAAEVDR